MTTNTVNDHPRLTDASAGGEIFTLLPRDYYISAEIFAEEKERFLLKQWHYAAHVSEIPKAGDYLVVEILGESVIVSRKRDGGINALYNVCRHRGFNICQESKGNKRRLVCPYHAWSYDENGRLIAAPSIADGETINYSEWSLKTVFVEVWQGCVFIALREPSVPDLAEQLDRVAADVLPFEFEDAKQIHQSSHIMNANWKVLVENYHECYHCEGNHPELGCAMDLDGMYDETDNPDRFTEFYGGGTPVKPGVVSLTLDGQPASRILLGEYGRGREFPPTGNIGFAIWPLLSKGMFSIDHATVQTARPLGHNRVEWVTRWFVHQDSVEGEDYDLEKLTAVWDATNEQDMELVNGTYRGICSEVFEPGPLSVSREPALVAFVKLYKELMGIEVFAELA